MRLRWLSVCSIDFDQHAIITERNPSSFRLCALRVRPR